MSERYRCDQCGHEVPRGRIPVDDVGSARHNCDRAGLDSDVPCLGPSRQGRMVLVSASEQPFDAPGDNRE